MESSPALQQPPPNFWQTLERPLKVLAPMEDVTDVAFRQLLIECGRPDVFLCEFVSTDGLCSRGREGVIHRLKYSEEQRPIVAQIWGNKPEHYYTAARDLREMGFDGVDINMGCPVPKIVKNAACSALIENPELAKELIIAAKEGASPIPVSVKTRLGFKTRNTEKWTEFLLQQKIAALTMHARTAKQLSKVPADWDEIGKVVRIRNEMQSETIIIGNGDVYSLEDLNAKHQQYGVDGVMVGRALLKNPYFFNPTVAALKERSATEKLELLLRHAKLFCDIWGDSKDFRIMKRFYKVYANGFRGASELRVELMECDDFESLRDSIQKRLKQLC